MKAQTKPKKPNDKEWMDEWIRMESESEKCRQQQQQQNNSNVKTKLLAG